MEKRRKYRPYEIMALIYLLFIIIAFFVDTPGEIIRGLKNIVTSRSVLITDYMEIGGIGATLINSVLVGVFSIIINIKAKLRPNGSTIMGMWISTGFAMFGKNIFNMIPITLGVWLYAKVRKEPFMNFTLTAVMCATLTPVVSGIAFHPLLPLHISLPLGIAMGIMAGFIFPTVSAFTVRVHSGYDLYNMGFAGGLISTFIVSGFESFGFRLENELHWSEGNNLVMGFMLYAISALLIFYGLFSKKRLTLPPYKEIMENSGRSVSDFLVMYGDSCYFNMGLLCALSTTMMLFFGASLNGPTICGIFTIVGFAAFGKHLKNIVPILVGAIICCYVNKWDFAYPSNVLAILFSTGLAPIAGQFGPVWGVIAGFLHVNTIMHIGLLNSGLNLYNNGYAAGFVAMLLIPIITAFYVNKSRHSH